MLTWGHGFVTSNVHDQLAQQQISFPPKAAFAHPKAGTEITPSMIPSVSQYAGERLLTGPQARAYANDFIGVHLAEMPYGGVYARISAAAMAAPTNAKLQGLKQTSFLGTTLRGLLLEAYAFSTIGSVMLWGAIASFVLGIMSVLVALGFWHARRTASETQILRPAGDRGCLTGKATTDIDQRRPRSLMTPTWASAPYSAALQLCRNRCEVRSRVDARRLADYRQAEGGVLLTAERRG